MLSLRIVLRTPTHSAKVELSGTCMGQQAIHRPRPATHKMLTSTCVCLLLKSKLLREGRDMLHHAFSCMSMDLFGFIFYFVMCLIVIHHVLFCFIVFQSYCISFRYIGFAVHFLFYGIFTDFNHNFVHCSQFWYIVCQRRINKECHERFEFNSCKEHAQDLFPIIDILLLILIFCLVRLSYFYYSEI